MKTAVLPFIVSLAQRLMPACVSQAQAQQYAWTLLQKLTGLSEAHLLARGEIDLEPADIQKMQAWEKRLVEDHEPLAYVVGFVPFLDLTILTKAPVLIPRPETEWWVGELCLAWQRHKYEAFNILDLCTGSGCVALALARFFPQSTVLGTDISADALALARKNALCNDGANVSFVHADLFDGIDKNMKFDLVVANPPYIPAEDFESLEPSVRLWEDYDALIAPNGGFTLVDRIIRQAPQWLTKRFSDVPVLWVEIDATQGQRAKDRCREVGWRSAGVLVDLAGRDRVLVAHL